MSISHLFTFVATIYYELKTIIRSKLYLIYLFVNIIMIIYNFRLLCADWRSRSIQSSIPYRILLFENVLLIVFGIILTSAAFKDETMSDAKESLYTRSFANCTYVLGKLAGIGLSLLSGIVFVLGCTMIYHIVFLDDVNIHFIDYITYPLILSIPVMIFVIGATYLTMMVIKNQGLAICLLFVVFGVQVFQLNEMYHSLFDLSAFTIPLLSSDYIGFGNIVAVLQQRSFFVFLGLGCMIGASLLFPRLPQTRLDFLYPYIALTLCIAGAFAVGHSYVVGIDGKFRMRKAMRALNETVGLYHCVTVTDCSLNIVHEGYDIAVTAFLAFENPTETMVDTCYFSLNPGFTVLSVKDNGGEVGFNHTLHMLAIEKQVNPGVRDSLTIRYRGRIEEAACYLDIDDADWTRTNFNKMCTIDKRYGFITPDYVLLTSETHWYPTAGVPYGSRFPTQLSRDLVRFVLTVKTGKDMTVISQGRMIRTTDDGTIFTPEMALTQVSLAIGNYIKKSVTVDGIEYSIYVKDSHDFFSEFFSSICDKLPKLIRDTKDELEFKLGLQYPFKRFSVVEVPVQFLAHRRFWSDSPMTIQPEQVLIQEMGTFFEECDLKKQLMYAENYPTPIVKTPEEIRKHIFNKFARSFINLSYFDLMRRLSKPYLHEESPFEYTRTVIPNYCSFIMNIESYNDPLLSRALLYYIDSRLNTRDVIRAQNQKGRTKTIHEIVNPVFAGISLYDLIHDTGKRDIMNEAFYTKSAFLFTCLKAVVGSNEFDDFLFRCFFVRSRDTSGSYDFCKAFSERFGYDPKPFIHQWAFGKGVPSYDISEVECRRNDNGVNRQFNYTFTITNSGPVDGVFSVKLTTHNDGIDIDYLTRYHTLSANETKKIGVITDTFTGIEFNTYISRNYPNIFIVNPKRPEHEIKGELFDGEITLDAPLNAPDSGEIIVDNVDEQFRTINGRKKTLIQKLLDKRLYADKNETIVFTLRQLPETWRHGTDYFFYGKYMKSAHYIKSGDGKSLAQWFAQLPDNGMYGVYCYCTRSWFWCGELYNVAKDHHYIIHHRDGVCEAIQKNINIDGWMYLGEYSFSKGSALIELSNKSSGSYVVADAIKFVKKSGD